MQQEFDFEAMAGNKGACKDCAENFPLLQWTKKDLGPIVTRFFKVLIGNDFQEALVIPPNFVETVQDLVDQETVIEDLSGTRWTVTLSYYKDLLAFHKGWSEFFVAFGLQEGDFLVVNYIKGSHFVIHVFGRNGCERVKTATTHQPLKAARSSETVATATRRGAKKRNSSRTSAKNQTTETNCITNSEAEKEKQVCMDKEFYMMVDREAGHPQSDYRTCLSLDGKECTSGHAQADNIDGKSNLATLRKSRKSRKSSNGSSSQNPLSPNRNLNKELKIAEKTKKASARARKRALEPSAGEEGGNSLESLETINVVKTEPVGSLDVPPPTTDSSFTCLAVPNSSVFIELPSPLPLVLFHKARQGKASMTIEDPQGRDWGCVYHEQLDFRVIIAPWFKINEENAIRTGDLLKFTMVAAEPSFPNKYKFDIVRKQPDN